MKPVEFEGQNTVFAKDQPQYLPLPAHFDADGWVTSCWGLSDEEVAKIISTKKLWMTSLTFKQPLQPFMITVDRPDHISPQVPNPDQKTT